MWIELPDFGVSVVAHRDRPDLLMLKFRTYAEGEKCVQSLDRFTSTRDREQQRAYIFGMTPGVKDYPYRIVVRRAYFAAFLFHYAVDLGYHSFKEETEKRSRGLFGLLRKQSLTEKAKISRVYGQTVYSRIENYQTGSTPRPVYAPVPLEQMEVES